MNYKTIFCLLNYPDFSGVNDRPVKSSYLNSATPFFTNAITPKTHNVLPTYPTQETKCFSV
ncbi:MAG: hypothetical protein F6K17_32030 [Okeania sp. SIO3C4]|nr:hypothetical protein [Okeania sp. SIO3C4]